MSDDTKAADPHATDGIGHPDPEPAGEIALPADERTETVEAPTEENRCENDLMYLRYFRRLIRHLTTDGVLELMLRQLMTPQEREPIKGLFRDRQNAAQLQTSRDSLVNYNTLVDQQLTDAIERIRRSFTDTEEGDKATTIDLIEQMTLSELVELYPTLMLCRDHLVGGPTEPGIAPPRWWSSRTDRYYDRTPWTWLNYYYHELHLNHF